MHLDYLDFEYSEDTGEYGTFEAMASTGPQQVAAVHAEIAAVLGWAHAAFAGQRGPLAEGGEWDYDLQAMQEFSKAETLHYDEASGRIAVRAESAGMPRHTVTLSVTGTPGFCDAFRERFVPD